jgi:hypothetical protein
VHLSSAANAKWVYFYSKHVHSYVRIAAFYQGKLPNSHVKELCTSTLATKVYLVKDFLAHVCKVDLKKEDVAGQRVWWSGEQAFTFDATAKTFLANKSMVFQRVFGGRRNQTSFTKKNCKAIAKRAQYSGADEKLELTPKSVYHWANAALKYIGLTLVPVSRTGRGGQKIKKKKPVGYKLRWLWTREITLHKKKLKPPSPEPRLPFHSGWQLKNMIRIPADAAADDSSSGADAEQVVVVHSDSEGPLSGSDLEGGEQAVSPDGKHSASSSSSSAPQSARGFVPPSASLPRTVAKTPRLNDSVPLPARQRQRQTATPVPLSPLCTVSKAPRRRDSKEERKPAAQTARQQSKKARRHLVYEVYSGSDSDFEDIQPVLR